MCRWVIWVGSAALQGFLTSIVLTCFVKICITACKIMFVFYHFIYNLTIIVKDLVRQ